MLDLDITVIYTIAILWVLLIILNRLFYGYFVHMNKAGAEKALNRLKSIDPAYSEIPRMETLLAALP